MDQKDVFLCHASEDKAVARNLSLGLAQYGVTTWIDEAEMRPGDRLAEKLATAIHHQTRWVIVLLTNNSVEKKWVRFELSHAISREIDEQTAVVIPVLLYDCAVPDSIKDKLYVDLRDYGNYEHGLQRLASTIKGDLQDVPANFRLEGIEDLSEDELLQLPRSQAILELNFRTKKWLARRVRTMSQNSGLMPKQVIAYCEKAPHILVSPLINNAGDIYYGRRDRIMKRYSSDAEYQQDLNRFLNALRVMPSQSHPTDVVLFFMAFHS